MTYSWSTLGFRHPFRKYQRLVLAQIDEVLGTPRDDGRYHIVAPPGSGKTIIGLELIRRFARPALVLVPTITIQQQWREKMKLFLPPEADLEAWVSLTPEQPAPLRILTYQRLAVQDTEQTFMETASRTAWAEVLVSRGLVPDLDAADRYLKDFAANNPEVYRREIRGHYRRLKRRLLREDPSQIARFLHPNALALIERLAAEGIGTVVLDECHHLLDHWAIVVRYLLARLEAPRVVGLTATLPSPEDDFAYENYTTLLGSVDFEVPTPAVVKEGNLAPYRDLVYFTHPTSEEMAFLQYQEENFRASLGGLLTSERFLAWLSQTLGPNWQAVADEDPEFALAGLRWLRQQQRLPSSARLPAEALEDASLDDFLALIERYALRALLPSADPEDHRAFQELKRRLRPFGFTLTPRGLHQGRTPGDLILAFSDSKIQAVREILLHEHKALGDRLRAIVVTDYEQSTMGMRKLQREAVRHGFSINADLGSARRVFLHLSRDPELAPLHPVLVTGKSLWIDAGFLPAFIEFWKTFSQHRNYNIQLVFLPRDGYYEVRGRGEWGPHVYVPLLTSALEHGLSKVLIGTRGLLGEGWDALSLNVLIDLTNTTTSTGVQQLRGRSLRHDPNWPHKVAHNWDVICVAPQFEKGNTDLQRFLRRHEHLWGLVYVAPLTDYLRFLPMDLLLDTPPSGLADYNHRVARGVLHVEPYLALQLAMRSWRRIPYENFTQLMLASVSQRETIYQAWDIGAPYDSHEWWARHLALSNWRIRTAYTVQHSLQALWRNLRFILSAILTSTFIYLCQLTASFPEDAPLTLWVSLWMAGFMLMAMVQLILARREIAKALRALLIEQPPDAILLDMGRALLEALRETGMVSPRLTTDHVRVTSHPDGTFTVSLDYAAPEDTATFIQAYGEMFAPIRNQRYLILRTDARLPNPLATGIWRVLRLLVPPSQRKPAYHPVPTVLATHRKLAETFARAWQQYVGGGQLIYTRSPEGRSILYQARLQQRTPIRDIAFTFWR